MMILTAAVVVLGLLCILNLAVSTAVIRRLRQQPPPAGPPLPPPGPGPAPGDAVPDFAVTPPHGPPVDRASLRGRHTVVAFFATACATCGDHAPRLAGQAPAWSAAGVRTVAAILDNGPDERHLHRALAPLESVLTDADARTLMRAFDIEATPTYYLLGPDGTVTAVSADPGELPLPLPAT